MTQPSNELERRPHHTLALADEQTWWSERQMAGLRQIGVDNASDGDLLVFFHVCQRTGLDPFARQIHMVARNTQDGRRWTIQTGIDGYRLIADRADRRDGTLREYEDTQWADGDGNWSDVWVRGTHPTAARVVVLRNGHRFPAVALYAEYVQTKRDGNPNAMWSRMPANQLAKCAEALALRKAYPQDMAGVYTDDEMAQADNTPPTIAVTADDIRAQAESAPSAPANEASDQPVDVNTDDAHEAASAPFNTRGGRARHMFGMFNQVGIPATDKARRLEYCGAVIGRPIESSSDLSVFEAEQVIAALEYDVTELEKEGTDGPSE